MTHFLCVVMYISW